jgi:hypothetical protein
MHYDCAGPKGWQTCLAASKDMTAWEKLDELAAGIETSMCSSATSPTELIVLSRVVMAMPEAANGKGLDCMFTQHPQEDAVLWSALDAWQRSGLPKSEAVARIERTAQDPRTTRRLLSLQEQRNQALLPADDEVEESDGPVPSVASLGRSDAKSSHGCKKSCTESD